MKEDRERDCDKEREERYARRKRGNKIEMNEDQMCGGEGVYTRGALGRQSINSSSLEEGPRYVLMSQKVLPPANTRANTLER